MFSSTYILNVCFPYYTDYLSDQSQNLWRPFKNVLKISLVKISRNKNKYINYKIINVYILELKYSGQPYTTVKLYLSTHLQILIKLDE